MINASFAIKYEVDFEKVMILFSSPFSDCAFLKCGCFKKLFASQKGVIKFALTQLVVFASHILPIFYTLLLKGRAKNQNTNC